MNFLAFLFSFILPIAAFAQAESPTYDQVLEVLKASQPSTVAKALTVIKSKYPTYFNQYSLVSKSMSIQGATREAPRVIAFDTDANLVLSFNGAADQRGYDRIELMAFNEELQIYDFREIKFLGETNTPGTYEVSESGGVGGRCLRCHGENALPIWDSYPFWPDYYGAFALTSYRRSPILSEVQQNELASYTNFINSAKNHERYKVLDVKAFSTMTDMNLRIGRAFAEKVRQVAKRELSGLAQVSAKLSEVFLAFMPSDHVRWDSAGVALPIKPLSPIEVAELEHQSRYHTSKISRYADNYGVDQNVLLDRLLAISPDAVELAAKATGIPSEKKAQLWAYTQIRPADLILLPRIREALGQDDILYLNSWSMVPGRRFIDFSHPDGLQHQSDIENALADLL